MNPDQARRSIAREYAIERLGDKTTEIINRIAERLVSHGTARVYVIVPHQNFRKQVAGWLAYAVSSNGLPIVSGSSTRFLGQGYDISVEPVSGHILRGRMFDTIYMPPPETLTRKQEYEYSFMQHQVHAAERTTKGFSQVVY